MDNYQIRRCLYSAQDLYDAFDPADESSYAKCYDARIHYHPSVSLKKTDIHFGLNVCLY